MLAYFLLVLDLILSIFSSVKTFCCSMAEQSCRATTNPSIDCWTMTFPGWSESNERLRSGSISIVGPPKHRSPADLGKFGRSKNVRRWFKSSKDRLLLLRRYLEPGSLILGFILYRAFAVYLRVLALWKRVDRARNVRDSFPRHGPLVGSQSDQNGFYFQHVLGNLVLGQAINQIHTEQMKYYSKSGQPK